MTDRDVRRLREPQAFRHPIRRAKLIQTHTSWVILTGEFAYKIKKPVNFGFLDYTTLAARKRFCERELSLNQRLSPEMYLGVLPVTQSGVRLRFGGPGRVVDYCLKMREYPQTAMMTERLQKGRVSYAEIDEIARIVARFHTRAGGSARVRRFGRLETVKFNWDENFAQTDEFVGRTISRAAFREIRTAIDGFETTRKALFARRVWTGRIRECHGDLHSRNIFMGRPIRIFDCIEFNPRFSCCDVASEVAFFVMDLEYHGAHELANYFVDRYIALTGDAELLRILGFYKCYRAYVRGKVTSFVLNDPGAGPVQKRAAARVARRYFQLARRYAAGLTARPALVLVTGLPGTGKTYLAFRLAEHLGMYHLRADVIRKELMAVPVGEHRYGQANRGIYSHRVSSLTYRTLLARGRSYLRCGVGVILDATFSMTEGREQCRQMAVRAGARFLVVNCVCPERVVLARLRHRLKAFSFSDATAEVYLRMKRTFVEFERARYLLRVDTTLPTAKSVKRIEAALLRL